MAATATLDQAPVSTDAIARIRDEGLRRSQVMETAFWLTDRYGPRLSGSPEFDEAGDWAIDRLRSWGVASVRKDRFSSGRGWSLTNFHATMVEPRVMPLVGLPRAWTPGTGGVVTAEVVRPIIAGEADAAKYRGQLRGKVVLLQPARAVRMLEAGDGTVLRYDDHDGRWRREAMTPPEPPPAARGRGAAPPAGRGRGAGGSAFSLLRFYREEGVVALLDRGPDSDLSAGGSDLSWRTQRADGGTIVVTAGASPTADPSMTLPQVTLAVEHYNRMVRLLDRDVPVRMEIDIGVRFTEESQASNFNIVGEIPGTDKRDELVVIGAHFDSWHGATGATDNAAGVAAMMEVLRIVKTVGLAPRRTIRIGLWGNEEGGFVGSASYAATYLGTRDAPKPEHAKTSVYFNLDNGTGPIRGIWTQGNANARAVFETWTRPVADLGVNLVSPRPVGQTDHVSFDRVGVPGFQFVQERYEYNSRTHHSNMDVYDRLQAEDLRQVATVAAVYVWQAANADSLVPRLTEAP
jgi:hypothetical protein